MNELREQVTQMRQKPTTQGAAFEALVASSKANEKLLKVVGNSIYRSNSVTSKAPESLIRFVQGGFKTSGGLFNASGQFR